MTDSSPKQPSYWLTAGGRTFLTIWIGQFVSLIGSGLTSFALSVWIYEETGSVTQFVLNSLGFYVSSIVLAPLAGVVTDRVDRRLVMILTDALAGIATLAVFFLYRADALQVWHIYAATFLNAAAGTFQWPAYSAATTMMVPKEHLGRASGMTQAADSLSSLIVPGLAGLIYVSIGMNVIFAVDIVSFLFSIFTLLLVRIPMPAKSEHT